MSTPANDPIPKSTRYIAIAIGALIPLVMIAFYMRSTPPPETERGIGSLETTVTPVAPPTAKNNHERFIGEWMFDMAKMAHISPKVKEQLKTSAGRAALEKMAREITLTIEKKTLSWKGGQDGAKGAYTVLLDETNVLRLLITDAKNVEEFITVTFSDNNHVSFKKSDTMGVYHLKRK